MTELSKFENMKQRFANSPEAVREELTRAGAYDAMKTVKLLMKLQSHACAPMFCYVFGDQLGQHYAEKFAACGCSLLRLFQGMGEEERFIFVYIAITDPVVFYYG